MRRAGGDQLAARAVATVGERQSQWVRAALSGQSARAHGSGTHPVGRCVAPAGTPAGVRLLLDPAGVPLLRALPQPLIAPISVALGPEGGLEEAERSLLLAAGFVQASVGETILRFETAGVAALAAVRAALAAGAGPTS